MQFLIEHLSKNFDKKPVLRDISFSFEAGQIYGLLGRNGAGKTTLFNCVNGDLRADSGAFWLEEGGARRPLAPTDVGYVLSTPTVPEFLTAREFLRFFLQINAGQLPEQLTEDEYFDLVGLAPDDRDRLLKDYSHGMKNKMQMLICLAAAPNLLLLDEPLTSLDVVAAEEMKQLLRSRKQGRVIVLSTHILELALDLCDEIVILNHGTLEAIDRENLQDSAFKARIIEALKEQDDA